jgi:DNA-directed RNA polymerase specialized sigma subunit
MSKVDVGALQVSVAVADTSELSARRVALMAEHTNLVRRIAFHLFRRRNYVNVDDLIEAGMTGLGAAVAGHEHATAAQFEAYASTLIRGTMLEFVRKSDWSRFSSRKEGVI